MNIRRMAEQYRCQVAQTGERARRELRVVTENPCDYAYIDSACRYLRQWYLHLERALGEDKGLVDLRLSWENLNRMKEAFRGDTRAEITDETDKRRLCGLANIARIKLGQFLDLKLHVLIEKSLTKSVRESGIKLR